MNAKLRRHVADLHYTVGALYVALVDLEGRSLVESGDLGDVDKDALKQFLSGSFRHSRELARAFLEPQAFDLHYYGKRHEIFCHQVGDSSFLVLVIDRESSTVRAGGVLLYLKRTIDALGQELGVEESRRVSGPLVLGRASGPAVERGNGVEAGVSVSSDGAVSRNGERARPAPPAWDLGSTTVAAKRAEPKRHPASTGPEVSVIAYEDEILILEEANPDSETVEEIGPQARPDGETFDLREAIRRGLVPAQIARRLGPKGTGEV